MNSYMKSVPHSRAVGTKAMVHDPTLSYFHGKVVTIERLTRANAEEAPAYMVLAEGDTRLFGPVREGNLRNCG